MECEGPFVEIRTALLQLRLHTESLLETKAQIPNAIAANARIELY